MVLSDNIEERTAREGMFGNEGYKYFGDKTTKKYHLRSCERLDEVEDSNLQGLGKNPGKNGWSPCPLCIKEVVIYAPQESPKPNPKPSPKPAPKPVTKLAWENGVEAKYKRSGKNKAETMKQEIAGVCEEYGMHAEFVGGTAFITTIAGEWFFTYNDRPIRLHHKNYADNAVKAKRTTKLYHLQYETFASPLHVLKYISGHDLELKRRVMDEIEGEMAADRYYYGDADLDAVSRAIIFSARAHGERASNVCSVNAILHSAEAAIIAMTLTDDQDVVVAAALHDAVDEAKAKLSDIRLEFGVRAGKFVESVSDKTRPDLKPFKRWKERKDKLLEYLFSMASREERIIILSDALSMVRFFDRDCQKNGAVMWDKYGILDVEAQAWYYKGLRDTLGRLQSTGAWQEFNELVNNVFSVEKRNDAAAKPRGNVLRFLRSLFRVRVFLT